MKRFSQTFHRASIAACVGLIYAVLAVMSAGCALAHADKTSAHHHHTEDKPSSQHAVCSWVCQATSDIVAVAQPQMAVAWIVVEPHILVPNSIGLSSAGPVLQPRAPPAIWFPLHG